MKEAKKVAVRVRLYRNPKDHTRDGQIVVVLRDVELWFLEVVFNDGTKEVVHRGKLKRADVPDLLPTAT